METDYNKFYNLESYIFNDIKERFREEKSIGAFDFFCIVIWKANRMKSVIARGLLSANTGKTLEEIIRKLTNDIYKAQDGKLKLKVLMEDGNYKFRLPTASAILSAFYPYDFSVYDFRVCETLTDFKTLNNIDKFDILWSEYEKYIEAVRNLNPACLLRDNDRFLWGKSFYNHLDKDIKNNFSK